jgi:acylphosphatase
VSILKFRMKTRSSSVSLESRMNETFKAFEAIAKGRVQGVNFRYYTKMEAERIGITGEVKNMPDGTVYIRAEGPENILNEFMDFLKNGPGRLARVYDLNIKWYDELKNDVSFKITY